MTAPGLLLAHVTTRKPGSKRWTEGELTSTADGFAWRVTGRSLAAGEGDLVRVESAPDLDRLQRLARGTVKLFKEARASLVDPEASAGPETAL